MMGPDYVVGRVDPSKELLDRYGEERGTYAIQLYEQAVTLIEPRSKVKEHVPNVALGVVRKILEEGECIGELETSVAQELLKSEQSQVI